MTSAEPGQWRTNRTAYLRGIMDAFLDPMVEDITIMSSTQVGKTEAMVNMLGFAIDQDPAPALWVMPRENDSRSFSSDRLHPTIQLSPALSQHITDTASDMTKMEIKLDRMIIYFVGANSPAALAQKPIRYLFLDETDKYPRFSGKEADPIKLATERTRTYWNRKIVKCSTPTTREGYIYREYERTDRRRYYVPCPHCRTYQALIFTQVKWPADEHDPGRIREARLAWYECIECKQHINDTQKNKIIIQGHWVPDGCDINKAGGIIGEVPMTARRGFWLSALYSPWITFSECAAEFLSCRKSPELLMNFINSWLAEVWEEKVEETTVKKIELLKQEYDEGEVPDQVLMLTAGVDVQKDYFILTIRGWGVHEESWLIRACQLESWEDVVLALFKTDYPKKNGEPLEIRMSCIDSGYRTDEVYEVCRQWRDRARAIKGMETLGGVPYRVTRIERAPRTGALIPGGISLYTIDTGMYKDKITRLLSASKGDPSKWHIFGDPSDDYISQFCGEHKIIIRDRKHGRAREMWKPKLAGTKNHYWDAEVYAVAAADMMRVASLTVEGETAVFRPRRKIGENITTTGKSESWVGNRGRGWVRR